MPRGPPSSGKGVILSTSSIVRISGQASGVAYPASKFAVNGLTISLARELGPKGFRVNAVAPGITETDMMKAVPKEVIEPLVKQIPRAGWASRRTLPTRLPFWLPTRRPISPA